MTLPWSLVWAVQLVRALLGLGVLAAVLCWPLTGDLAWPGVAAAAAAGRVRLGRDLRRAPRRRTVRSSAGPVVAPARTAARPATHLGGATGGACLAGCQTGTAVGLETATSVAPTCGEVGFEDAFGRLLALVGVRVRLSVTRPGVGPLAADAEGVLRVGRHDCAVRGERFHFELAGSFVVFSVCRDELGWAGSDDTRLVLATGDAHVELRPIGGGGER